MNLAESNEKAIIKMVDCLKDAKEGKSKIVTIWGAGSSVKSGIPSGYYLMERMRNDLIKIYKSAFFKEKFNENYEYVKNRLERDINLTFEFVSDVYSRIYGHDKYHQWLKQYIPIDIKNSIPPYFPQFSHEYCAHLVKSKRLKYFISTNFDEILEQSIFDEIGYESCKVISSLSEFERLKSIDLEKWNDEYHNQEIDCYILKPHGTISRGLTLRDTDKKTECFEDEKKSVLINVLKDATIVFLGFGNYNENFWLLFGETYTMGLTKDIIIVDLNPDNVRKKLPDNRLNSEIFNYKGDIDLFLKKLKLKPLKPKNLKTRNKNLQGTISDVYTLIYLTEN